MDYDHLSDDKTWQEYLDERLAPKQRTYLERQWQWSETYRRVAWPPVGRTRPTRTAREIELAGRAWKLFVLELQVETKVGGLAVLRHPEQESWEVRVHSTWRSFTYPAFEYPRGSKHGPGRSRELMVMRIELAGGPFPYGWSLPLDQYVTALNLRYLHGRLPKTYLKAPADLPSPGQPPKTETYAKVLEAYEALAAEGNRAPAKELALRWGVEHSTMKTWLRRARKYLPEGGRE